MPEISPSTQDDPEPKRQIPLVEIYNSIVEKVPEIAFSEEWQAWIRKGDMSPSEFDSFQEYFDEFPYLITVDEENSFVTVTDPGSGSGAMVWEMRIFKQNDGGIVAVVSETDHHPSQIDSFIWFGRKEGDHWEELPRTIPYVYQHVFFDEKVDRAVLKEYELISILFSVDPKLGEGISISARPNFNFECVNGNLICAEEIPVEDHAAICHTWTYFRENLVHYNFNLDTNTFVLVKE